MSANHIRQLKNQIFRQAVQSPTKYHCGHPQKESNAAYNSEFSNEFICFIIAVGEINNCSAAFVKLPNPQRQEMYPTLVHTYCFPLMQ